MTINGKIGCSTTDLELSFQNAEGLCGGIAQLGERKHGMFEVAGSIPVTSTEAFDDPPCKEAS